MSTEAVFNHHQQAFLAGILLVLGTLVPIGALVMLLASGADFSKIISSSQQGLEEIANHVSAFRWSNILGATGILLALFGLSILTSLLQSAGDRMLAQLSLVAFLVSTLLFVIDLAFHMSVTVWAAQETARSSVVPDFYQPLRQWIETLQAISIVLGLISTVGYGGSILGTGLLPQFLGWACIGWSALWLLALIAGSGVPVGVLPIMPTVIGIVLLTQK